MNNETKILAISLKSILEGYKEDREFLYLNQNLSILKNYNTIIEEEEYIDDEDGEVKIRQVEKPKDKELQKIIIRQEKALKDKLDKEQQKAERLLKIKNTKIETVIEICNEILSGENKKITE